MYGSLQKAICLQYCSFFSCSIKSASRSMNLCFAPRTPITVGMITIIISIIIITVIVDTIISLITIDAKTGVMFVFKLKVKLTQCPIDRLQVATQTCDGGKSSVERNDHNITDAPSSYKHGKYLSTGVDYVGSQTHLLFLKNTN